jgi:filamentous hemagglutinin family protein
MIETKQTSPDCPRATAQRTGRAKTCLRISTSIRGLRCFRLGERIICYLLFAICYSGLGAVAQAGDILRGNTGGNNSSPATSGFYGGNQAAMSQLQTNAHDILSRVNQALSSVQALQKAARNAAGSGNVPNGLTVGGLQVATGKNAEWKGASLPTQSVGSGQTTVVIQQTSSQAILNWQTFNVGRHTTVDFNQSAGGSAANTWVALNRILDPSGSPSQILGSIKAQGQVYLINQNGIIFGGTSQVNAGSLLAASALITDSQFSNHGIYSTQNGQGQDLPSFTNAIGNIVVEAGAQLETNAPLGIADRGGSVILMGRSVENAGSIITANGQTVLAAGKDFFLRQGYSITPATGIVMNSTTLGTMIGADKGGTALNTGFIQATTGDITMAGGHVTQAGVLISTSSVDQRGTIHLLTATADSKGSVTLAPGSITYIEPDPNSGTALDPQRISAYALSSSTAAGFPTSVEDYAVLPDRPGISRIEITTGGTVNFEDGSLTSATAGQIEVSTGNRIFAGNGSILDVSGLVNVSLPMSANNLAVNIQGFELRDASLNRNTETLFNNTAYVDLRQLVEVPANSSYNAPYNTENRYYTPGGLLEVSGELNNVGHSIEEWDTIGGSITLASSQVVAQSGSVFNIAGGSIQYQAGYLKQSYVIASDGRIYNVNTAPAGIVYVGVYNGFVVNHPRWNVTETYQNVVTQPAQIYQAGYTVGRDAGSLTIDAATSIFEGTIEAQTFDGPQQNTARPSASTVTDPFLLTQSTVTLNGSLVVGPYTMVADGNTQQGPLYSSDVMIGNGASSLTTGLTATSSISKSLTDINTLSASSINNAYLGGLTVDVQAKPKASPASTPHQGPNARGHLTITGPLFFANGAQIALTAANVVLSGNITAPDGKVSINSQSYAAGVTSFTPAKPIIGITLKNNVIIDTQGVWTNAFLNPLDITGEAYINGGNVTLSSDQGIALQTGSLINASSGAAVLPNLKTLSGSGGNITIEADQIGNVTPPTSDSRQKLTVSQAISRGPLILDGALRSYGVKAGGALTLQAYSILIGDGIVASNPSQLVLPTSFFGHGFSNYTIHGMDSVTVQPGATIDVTEPIYQFSTNSFKIATGANLTSVFGSPQLMPVYLGNPDTATVTQRPGASLNLLAGVDGQTQTPPVVAAGGSIEISPGSIINVDPGQSINIEGAGQITVDGTLRAPSGSIEVVNYRSLGGVYGHGKNLTFNPGGLSVWIGSSARLDVSAQVFVAYDRFGRPYGLVPNAGSIILGSVGGTETVGGFSNLISTDAFVIIRPGATLDASGTSAVLDLFAGENPVESDNGTSGSSLQTERVYVASDGGSISMSSYDGIYIDGTLRAFSGGPGGAGGTLSLTLAGPIYVTPQGAEAQTNKGVPNSLRLPRSIVIGQNSLVNDLPVDLQPGQDTGLKIGSAYLSANAFEQGGFANLSLDAANSIVFKGNVTLTAAESITLTSISIADTVAGRRVNLSAPYVLLSEPITAVNGYGISNGTGFTTGLNNTPATSAVTGAGVFTVKADLIDLAYVAFGDSELLQLVSGTRTINRSAFANVDFISQSDIRFLPTASPLNVTAPGNITFTAAQLYPVTGAVVTVEAGYLAGGSIQPFVPGTSLSVYRINDAEPAIPQSVFGRLALEAETINQGGVIRAPLGAITLGFNGSGFTQNVNFLAGSVTSVSANGLTIPYGGTTDGVTYTVNGQNFSTDSVINGIFDSSHGITLEGVSVSVASGVSLDLSGGGTLFGEGFISGRGGSLDILSTALLNQNPSNTFSSAGNTVYALVPGAQNYAPPVVDTNTVFAGSMPRVGQQITVPTGVSGLPAGTYTLMPSNYALLPGAFRIELGARGNTKQPSVLSLDNGSYEVNVNAGVANTGILSALPTEAIITPASVAETYAQYDLETYNSVATSQARRFNQPRPVLPIDASTLTIDLGANQGVTQLSFAGMANFAPAAGGYSGALVIGGLTGNSKIEITGPNGTPTQGWTSLSASAVDAIQAPNIYIGGILLSGANTQPSQGSTFLVGFEAFSGTGEAIALRTGAVLTAADVFLIAGQSGITIQSGATIDTLNQGAPAFDSTSGYFFTDQVTDHTTISVASVLAVSNGYLNVLPSSAKGGGPITVDSGASLFSDGTIAFATSGHLNLAENANYGAKYIGFSAADINIGTSASLSAAQQAGTLPMGLLLDQTLLDDLLAGDPAVGAPALQILTLSAANSINIYGSVDLNTVDSATGKSTLQELVFNAPAVYGAGSGSDTVNITTGTLIWNGLAQISTVNSGTVTTYSNAPAGPVIAGGPGTGSGILNIVADEIVFGYGPMDQPQNLASLDRLVLGFSTVNLTAKEEIVGNSKGSLLVYLAETGPGSYTGGNLNLTTPLLTGAPGSVLSYKTGGTLTLTTPAGTLPATSMSDSLGAEIDLSANAINDSTSILAASGKISLSATGNISLNAGSRIDVSGLTVAMFDQSVPTFGGDVSLKSTSGDITQASSAEINVSATGANAGSLTISATGTTGGVVTLGGTLLGSSTDDFNAGSFNIQAQNFGDFISLNQALDTGGFFYARTFDLKQGSIDIPFGTTISAHTVGISVDNGSLTVSGTINASGATPGTIRLSSLGNLELRPTGILDVHSTVLQVDSYGQPIDAENRGVIELTVADGTNTSVSTLNNGQGSLLLDPGSTINMSSADGVDRGDLELNVPRTSVTSGTIRIQAGGPINISGAQTIAVNAFWTYAPTDPNGTIVQSQGPDVPNGAIILDQVNQDSLTFVTNAETGGHAQSGLAGLAAYTAAFHLRPGVEIVSATPNGNLTVLGDLDLSKYRYASVNPNSQLNSTYGSGEPGVLVLRAGGNLNIYGSINDGFAPLSLNGATLPDENGWVLFAGLRTLSNVVIETTGVTLAAGTKFSNDSVALSYSISIGSATLNANVTIPVTVTLASGQSVTTPFVATATITLPNGQVFHAGQTVPGGVVLPTGTLLATGSVLPFSIKIAAVTWPAGALLSDFSGPVSLAASVTLQPGDLLPAGSTPKFASGIKSVDTRPVTNGIQGQVYAVEQMLSLGPNGQEPLSWSMRLVAGADTGAADTEAVQQQSALNGSGNLILDDPHYTLATNTPIFSVIRTGTGYLDLLAGGNFTEDSLYGIYTAGAQTTIPGANNSAFNLPRVGPNGSLFKTQYAIYETIATQDYQAYYPDNGGNVLVSAQGTLTGFAINGTLGNGNYIATYNIGDWLWRQGGTGIGQSTAWWINFGTYVPGANNSAPVVTGFTGIGALGGGNVTVLSGGDAGVTSSSNSAASGSLFIAVAGTGRVTSLNGSGSGSLVETGGGDAVVNIGGGLNPVVASYSVVDSGFEGGELVDLRGRMNISANSIGGIDLVYGQSSNGDPRPTNVSTAALFSFAFGGPVLAPGDATIDLQVNGDLVLGNAADPGRVQEQNKTPVVSGTTNYQGESWFSLWTAKTGITLLSAGGNVMPIDTIASKVDGAPEISLNTPTTYQSYLFPTNLSIIATGGNIYSGSEYGNNGSSITYYALELAPSPAGQLQVLAEGSVYANAYIPIIGNGAQAVFFDISGADSSALPNPFDAAYYVLNKQGSMIKNGTNTSPSGSVQGALDLNLFAFEPDSASGTLHKGDSSVARIYAVQGDIVGLQVGEVRTVSDSTVAAQWHVAGKAMDIRAGADIVNFGESESVRSVILNNNNNDVSVVSAGNEILFANVDIAGPGNLELSAGGDVYQGAQAVIESIGLIGTPKLTNPDGGAGIIVLAGVGADGPNWTGFANLYLNPSNVADPNQLLVDQPGKVVATYEQQLIAWLQSQYGFKGTATEALSYFKSLPVAQQSVFLLQKVYFAELDDSGVEYNQPTSPFYHTYVRGNEAIASLFPTTGSDGQKINYNGSLIMFSAQSSNNSVTDSSILTDFGGGITTVVAGGQTVVGVTGVTPGAHSGILTQGSGDIDMYSQGSILLGESRVLTTFGGNIVIWSASGDINAGIGAKGTVIFAPPGIVYDDYNDIVLAPTVPSSGAGIGTLAPIPDVPPGNVDLVAPEGTIDAGEAGIRASGNANLAARVIVNAANISVAGKTTGIPTVVAPNLAAISAASNSVGATNNAANDLAKQQAANQEQPATDSVIIVEVLGYGGGDSDQ